MVVYDETAAFADGAHQSETRESRNPVLVWELDPKGAEVNSEAFRDRETAREKTPGVVRVALLGDSIAFGHGVPVEQGVANQLELALGSEYEVLNFGVGGYNTRQTAELYATKARYFDPDVIVLLYVLNDALPARRMAALADLVADLRSRPKEPPLGLHIAGHVKRAIEEARGSNAEETAPYVRETHGDERTWKMVVRGLGRIASIAREDEARAVMAITPLFFDLDPYAFRDIHEQVAEAGRRKGFAVIDLVPALRDVDERDLRLDPEDVSHPSPLGHRLIAEAIARELRAPPSP
jgi:lysophospholipase L1-like esterase